MARFGSASIVALGVALLIGGTCSLLDGFFNHDLTYVGSAFGPLSGTWYPNDYRFMGAVLAAAGGGLVTFGLMIRRRD